MAIVLRGSVIIKDTPGSGGSNPLLSRDASAGTVGVVASGLPSTLLNGYVLVGNVSNVATGVLPTGDVTITNTGVTAITTGAIVNADINTSAAIALSKLAALTASRASVTDASGFITTSLTTATELGFVSGVTSAIQTQLNAKQATIIGGATTITTADLTPNRVLLSSALGKVSVSTISDIILGYISTLTSSAQTQINTKLVGSATSAILQAPTVTQDGHTVTWNNGLGVFTLTSVTASGVPIGGTTGQYLAKTSNADLATGWTTLTLSKVTDVFVSTTEINSLAGLSPSVGSTQFNYLNGVTSAIQPQIDLKLSNNLAHNALFLGNISNTAGQLAPGSNNQVLQIIAGVPTWQTFTPGTGSVTSINVSGGTTGLTATGGPVTTTGTITIAGTVNVASGGTGLVTTTPYALLAAGTTATGAFQQVSGLGTLGQVLTSNGTGTLPTWQVASGGTPILQRTQATTTYTIQASDDGYIIYFTNAAGCTITIPDSLAVNVSFTSVRATGAGLVNHVAGGTSVLNTINGYTDIQFVDGSATWVYKGTNDWYGWGALGAGGGGGGSGTVTSVSVVSANGFTGTVATATTTPAITLTTSITGVLKGNGTAISAAVSGTDYSAGTSALATGILKSTTTTGALTIAIAADFPTLNQNTTGNAATVTTNASLTGDVTSVGNATTYAANLPVSKLNSGTGASISTFWRGDGTWATTPSGFANPMTTLGDMIYENATPAAARLAGNITTTKNFLVQTGTGAISAAPVWGTISAGDVPTLNQNTTGSAATLTTPRNINGVGFNGSADITVTAAAGTVTGATLNATVTGSSLTSVGTIATGTWNASVIGTIYGGTGQATVATGDLLYGSASNTWSKLAAIAAGSVLGSAGIGVAPAYLAVDNGLTATASTLKWGGALTANTSITGAFATTFNNTIPSSFNLTGAWTSTASAQANNIIAGSFTARATVSDRLHGTRITTTLIAGANTQLLSALDIAPTFTNGAFTSVVNAALTVQTGRVIVGNPVTVALARCVIAAAASETVLSLRTSSDTTAFGFTSTGGIVLGNATSPAGIVVTADGSRTANVTGSALRFDSAMSRTLTAGYGHYFGNNDVDFTDNTSGSSWFVSQVGGFTASSGSVNFTGFHLGTRFNQTGTATGKMVCMDINPTAAFTTGSLYGILVQPTTALNGFGTATPAVTVDVVGGLANRQTTKTQITANQNNYAIGSESSFRISSDAARSITGLTGGADGKILIIRNVGSFGITFTSEDVLSTAANRITTSTAASLVVAANGVLMLQYDATTSRWFDISMR